MSILLDNTERLIEQFNEKIRADLRSKNIDNTGTASNSIYIEKNVSENSISSKGVFYLEYLNRGSGPWENKGIASYKRLYGFLHHSGWYDDRGIEKEKRMPIAISIVENGSRIHKDRTKGIMLEEKKEELRKEINEKAPRWLKDDLLIRLKNIKVS